MSMPLCPIHEAVSWRILRCSSAGAYNRLGISRIHGGGECTYARADRYFSHRRDGITGRQGTFIWRES